MHVYFVRHGQTELNKKHIHQSPNTPLSEEGKAMMITLGDTLRTCNPDRVLSSQYVRALESARIIGEHVGRTPEVHDMMYEIVRPSKLHGKSLFTLETIWYVLLTILKRNNPSWRYADAENVSDISNRAKNVLAYIESLRGTHSSIIVVSHTVFINVIVAYMCKNRLLDIRDLIGTVIRSKRLKNAGVTHVEYVGNGSPHACNWRMIDDM